MVNISFKKRGFSLIEIIIASSIFLLAVTTIFSSYAIALKATFKNTAYLQAAFLAEEGNEALKNMRDFGWSNQIGGLNVGTPYRLFWASGSWQATTTTTFIDGKFDRTFTLGAVNRDGSNIIVSSGGTLDVNTKKVVVSVSWNEGGATTTKIMESYVSNIFSN